jgi:hypothetical protein
VQGQNFEDECASSELIAKTSLDFGELSPTIFSEGQSIFSEAFCSPFYGFMHCHFTKQVVRSLSFINELKIASIWILGATIWPALAATFRPSR